jgi:hypothetical protein
MAAMTYLGDLETFWLNITNIALGLAALAVISLVVTVAFREIWERIRNRQNGLIKWIKMDM